MTGLCALSQWGNRRFCQGQPCPSRRLHAFHNAAAQEERPDAIISDQSNIKKLRCREDFCASLRIGCRNNQRIVLVTRVVNPNHAADFRMS